MDGGAEFSEVDLRGTKVGGRLSMAGSTFTGRLHMLSLQVDASLLMSGGTFSKSVDLLFSTVGSNLVLSGATFETLDLTGTKIGSELQLGSDEDSEVARKAVVWKGAQHLILRDAEVHTIKGQEKSWPKTLELAGFTYNRLGSSKGLEKTGAMQNLPTNWFIAWLAKDSSYTPQPYEQLASVLREMGESAKADEILYASKERARRGLRAKDDWGSWVWATAQWAIIGHGYRLQFGLYWSIGLVLLGATVLRTTGQGPKHGMPFGLSYSLDMLLPILQLRTFHYNEVDLDGFARYYFYVHILVGYVLASFLVAGLSGLVK